MPAAKILLVDDDTEFASALAMVLGDFGYQVARATNGRDGLAILRTDPPPDVVVLDLEMPVMGGEAFCREKARDRALAALPVVLLSAHPDLGEGIRPEGVSAWFRKPIDVAALLRTVRRLTESSDEIADLRPHARRGAA